MLSQRGRYALKAMIHLAAAPADGGPQQIAAIAGHGNIPRKFLEAILVDLKKAGLVTSMRGQRGGYTLARPAAEIMIGDIMRVTDGPLALVPCVSKAFYRRCSDCADEATCAIRHIMALVREEVGAVLDKTTLEQAAALGLGSDADPTIGADANSVAIS